MVQAQQPDTIQEILNGFEDETPDSTNDELEDIIQGFEEDGGEDQDMEETLGDDDIIEGFDDDSLEPPVETTAIGSKLSRFSLDGYFELGASYNFINHKAEGAGTDWQGFSRLRADLNLELNAKFSDAWQARIAGKANYDAIYEIRGRDEYTDDVLDKYEKELEFTEVYILGSLLDDLDIKAGRQIVVWGTSDNTRVTDILNPLDLRKPGLTDIEDLRLPVTMTKLDYYIKGWSLSGIVIHEIRYNKDPEFGIDFFPLLEPLPSKETPDEGFTRTQFAAALHGIFSGWDTSFYWANVYDDMPHIDLDAGPETPRRKLKHPRLNMFGSAFNIALGNWLLKAEAAYFDGLEYFNGGNEDYSRIDALAGFEYSGFKDTTISLEIVNRHITNFDSRLERPPDNIKENRFESAIRVSKNFLNDTLTLTLLARTFNMTGQDGAFQRLTAAYDLTDSIKITGGVIFYSSGDLNRFIDVGDNDRFILDVRYSF